ncbi:MAG: cold-shock protein [Candidatus Pacearchaeota archaeon]
MKGKVKFFNETKGFGFLSGDDGKDYFVHASGLVGASVLTVGEEVSFEVEQGPKGARAIKVQKA